MIWECRQLHSERKLEEALQLAQKYAEMNSNSVMTPGVLSEIYIGWQRFEEAATELKKLRAMDDDPSTTAWLAYVYGRLGKTNEARATLQELEILRRSRYVPAYAVALAHLGLGETNETIRQLELACEERSPSLLTLKIIWAWDGLRTDPRFQALLAKVGLEK